jgi:hypothetical protein
VNDLRETLGHILRLRNDSRTYTRRTQQIHDVAMRGLGMTAGQRESRHMAIFERTCDHPAKQAYIEREARREAKLLARGEGSPP